MDSVDEFLETVRGSDAILSLPEADKRGAEAYLQAYEYIAAGNDGMSYAELRQLAWTYTETTASPRLSRQQIEAAELARNILRSLQP